MQRALSVQLREERAKLHAQSVEFRDRNKDQMTSPEIRSQMTKMLDELDSFEPRIAAAEKDEALDARVLGLHNEYRASGMPPAAPIGADDERTAKLAADRHKQAWLNAMKYGVNRRTTSKNQVMYGISAEDRKILFPDEDSTHFRNLQSEQYNPEGKARMEGRQFNPVEFRDLAGGNTGAYPGAAGTTGGFFIPVGFVQQVEEAMKWFGPMLDGGAGNPEIFDTATGQILPFPTDNDTTVMGELIDENAQVTSSDPSIGQITMNAYKYSSKMVKISIELLQDSAFNLEAWLVRKFAIRLGRILNNHLTVGTGTNQPNGIVTAATLGYTALGSSTNDGTGAGGNTIGSDDLINLEHSVDIAYRNGAKYMFHDTTLRSLKTVKDKYGRPLWAPGIAVQQPNTINSYPYLINNDMDQLQSAAGSPPVTKKTVLFGQLTKYLIRRVKEMTVLRLDERFADYGQVAFVMFCRYDGELLDAGTRPVRYLANVY